jgi:hypothetical protein
MVLLSVNDGKRLQAIINQELLLQVVCSVMGLLEFYPANSL